MAKRIAILGSTGSIGQNALRVIEHLGDDYRAIALSAHTNARVLLQQVEKWSPNAVAVTDGEALNQVRGRLDKVQLYAGEEGLCEMVRRADVDTVLAAIVGAAGVKAVFAAVEANKSIALANKESLVVAGSLLIPEARRRGVSILPVDSEHSAIFQAMLAGKLPEVRRVVLTASGGPFRDWPIDKIRSATPEDALKHPTWAMGNKITIDSATMFNKALELIEACWLFDLPPSKIDIVIHPESIVHSFVEYVDGSVIAQLSPPDMKTPIQYALTYPDRLEGCSNRLDWGKAFNLTFAPPDFERFPALQIAYDVARRGGDAGAVMNAANEEAVGAFLAGRINFGEISDVVGRTIAQHPVRAGRNLDELLAADNAARRTARSFIDASFNRK